MNHQPDDVGQSLGLPDFIDPSDVVEASFDASTTWGEERSSPASGGFEPRDDEQSSSAGRRGSSGSSFGEGARSSGRGAKGKGRKKKQLTWAEKAERREKRAQKRREEEAAEREKDPLGFAREIVLRQLTAAPKSRAQLADKLREKEVDDDVAEAVLDRMEDVKLVDDEAYAGMLVRSQVASRGLARKALAQELKRKGITPEVAEGALEQVDDDAERAVALQLARKKMTTMSRLDEQTQTRRLAGLLARKGYPPSLVWSVIKEIQGSAAPDEAH